MSITPGTKLGVYEILGPLGAGGMGEVYRAHDTRLNRDVAIKMLPESVAADTTRLARFEREARTLAALNHPNIAQIFGLEDAGARGKALVMELVPGPTLADRIAAGPLPIAEALDIARQIAEALETAHAEGIVHRDLKPANIKVRDDGSVKVLDFGLAKASDSGAAASVQDSPTITSPAMTERGIILGTAAYMSPEQARGRPVDKRADVWALGVILFEMLTGRQMFAGDTVSDTLAAVLREDVRWSDLPAGVPASARRLLERTLQKDPKKRLRDLGDARLEIEDAIAGKDASPQGTTATVVLPTAARASRVPWLVTAAALTAVAALGWANWNRETPAAFTHVGIELPPRTPMARPVRRALTISPDGSAIAFVASSKGVDRIYVRRSDEFDARPIEGTEGASDPDFSPDGRWLAFVSGNALYRIPATGGSRIELAAVNDPRGLSWDVDDRILLTPESVGGVSAVPVHGGSVTALTKPVDGEERTHRWPQMLPGGKVILFTVGDFNNPDSYVNARIDAQILATGERKTILRGAEMARYAETGHLVFARAGGLFAVPFDAGSLTAGESPERVLDGVAGDATTGAAHFDISSTGRLAYVASGAERSQMRLALVDQKGQTEVLGPPAALYSDPAVSPDGKRVAVSMSSEGRRDIWVYHTDRKTFTRLTFNGMNITPRWSTDGRWVYYVSPDAAERLSAIWRRTADGSREAEKVGEVAGRVYLDDVTRDERTAIVEYSSAATRGGSDIIAVQLHSAGAAPRPVVATPSEEYAARLSPDGRWIAYESIEASRPEIFVRPFDAKLEGRWQVSTAGGREPKWSRDGRTLYFRYEKDMLAASIAAGPGFEYSVPRRILTDLYDLRVETGISFDVHTDGRFAMIQLEDDTATPDAVRVLADWFRLLTPKR